MKPCPTAVIRLFRLASPASRPASDPAGASLSLVDPSGQTLFDGRWPEFSPDGRYIAYQSAGESRRNLRATVPAGGERPLANLDGGRDAPRVVA